MIEWSDEVVLVTGASTGLGKALALEVGRLGATVVGIARSADLLAELQGQLEAGGGSCFCYSADIGELAAIPALCEQIVADVGRSPTILMNNVGFQVAGFVENTPVSLFEESLRVNALAPLAFIQAFLPTMKQQGRGVIANVFSSIMYHSFPGVACMCAAKFALRAIHESLKVELSNYPLSTLLIRPGSFRSEYWRNTDQGDRLPDYPMPTGEGGRDPQDVAADICRALAAGKEEIDLGTWKDKVGYHLSYWAPTLLARVISRKQARMLAAYDAWGKEQR